MLAGTSLIEQLDVGFYSASLASDKVRVSARRSFEESVGRQIRQDGDGLVWLLFVLFMTSGFNLDGSPHFTTHSSCQARPFDDDDEVLDDDDDRGAADELTKMEESMRRILGLPSF